MTIRKQLFAKVYQGTVSGTNNGSLITTIKDFQFDGFSWAINSGLGECKIQIPKPVKSYGELSDISLFNQFDIYILDKESDSQGYKIYSGYLIEYTPQIYGTEEYIDCTLWGYQTEFAVKILEDGTNTTLTYNSQDPSNILQDVFQRYDGKIKGYNSSYQTIEDFSDTVYEDVTNTTASWNGYGSLNLLTSAIEQTNSSRPFGFGYSNLLVWFGQSFKTNISQNLNFITLKLAKVGNPTDNLSVSVYNGIFGTLIETSNSISGSTISSDPTYNEYTFTFSGTSYLTKDIIYTFKISRSGSVDSSNYYAIILSTNNPYLFGDSYDYSSGIIRTDIYSDLYFKINSNTYNTSNNIIQSQGYDTKSTSNLYSSFQSSQVLPNGCNVSYQFADSADNVTFGSWTSNFSSLTKRFFKWKATLTGTSTATPVINSLTFNFQSGSIGLTGYSTSYTFKQNSIQEALDQCRKMSPPYWYWRVGSDNKLVFDVRNTSIINHILTIGKDITSLKVTKSAKELKNAYYFLGGGSPVYIRTDRTSSQSSYGRRIERSQDERVTDNTSAGIIANTFLDVWDHAMITVECEVIDSNGDSGGYDIETFQPGQIVKIIDPQQQGAETLWDVFNWDQGYWDFPINAMTGLPLQIMSLDYSLDKCKLQLSFFQEDGIKRIEDIKRNLDQFRTSNSPTTPTVV